jgi:uncharacterized membrane protein YhaH (DUF805 family)
MQITGATRINVQTSSTDEGSRVIYDGYDMMMFGPIQMLLVGLLLIIPFWQIFSKAGYSGWWSLLMVVPLVNLIALYVLAFSNWPAQRR